jgi:hypothetical protein
MIFRPSIHLILHFIIPGIIARWVFSERWKNAWLIMLLTMVVDFDHLLAVPIYDPNRCGIGFHPLHSYLAIIIYLGLTAISRTRIAGLGLLIHMALDGIDCLWMSME